MQDGSYLENLFFASSSEQKGHLTLNLVGSIGVTCRSEIAKIVPVGNPKLPPWRPFWNSFYTPPHDSIMGYYGFTLGIHVSVRPSVHLFFVSGWVKINGFSPNLVHVCALILWRSGLGLFTGKFHPIFTEISASDMIMEGYFSLKFLFLLLFLNQRATGPRSLVDKRVDS